MVAVAEAVMRADLLVCAASKQRELYERLQSSDAPGSKSRSHRPQRDRRLRETKDNIVIWGGGTWEWLDPAAAVDAVVRVNQAGVPAKLLFSAVPAESQSDRPPARRPLRPAPGAGRAVCVGE